MAGSPRRRKSSKSSNSSSPRQASKRRRSTGASRRKPLTKEQIEAIYTYVAKRVYEELGLDLYGIDERVLRDVLEPIVLDIVQQVSRPNPDSIVKRVIAGKQHFLKGLAARLLDLGDELTREQLDFILVNAPDIAGRAAPLLYHVAVRHGAHYAVEALRDLWASYGNPTAAPCPRCGFKALTPDYSCIVCGSSISEDEFKAHVGLRSLLQRLKIRAPRLAIEAARAGYVYYDDGEVKAPSEPHSPSAIQVYLSRSEKEELLAAEESTAMKS